MEKKVQDILDAFQNHRFEDALRQIEQLAKKVGKDTKKKNSLSDHENRLIQLVKCGSLANLGRVHQAHQIMQTFFTQKVLSEVPDKEKFMLVSIAEMAYDEQIQNKIQIFNKANKGDVKLQRYLLSLRQFSTVSKSFLKQFATQKREEDGLAQIFLEYVNELNKVQLIQNFYSKDLLLQPNKQLNLKMVELFFMKYFSGINLGKLENVKLRASIIDLRIRLAINGSKTQDAKKFYLEHFEFIQENFVYLRSIREMPQNQSQNYRFYIENCGVIFRRNLEIEKYVPLYDFYDQFLDFILSEKITKDYKGIWESLEQTKQLNEEQLYNFKQIPNEAVVVHYFRSLSQQLKSLTTGQKHAIAQKSDYFKISIKGLMLQLLKILFSVAHKTYSTEQAQKYLAQSKYFNSIIESYFMQFSKTFTYPNQMRNYFSFLKDKFESVLHFSVSQKLNFKLPNTFSKPDDNLILLSNAVKILTVLNKPKLSQWKETQIWIQYCWGFYKRFIQEVEQTKRRQKGQIFLSDQFIIILSDLVIYHVENLPNYNSIESQSFIESVLIKLMAILDEATELSPFNGYLKLKVLYVCQKLNYFDRLCDTFISLDIKSVQFETLGYFLINPLNSFNLYSQSEDRLIRMVRSYQENQRETSEYCLKGLKAGTTHQVFEYFSYQKRLEKSFSLMNLFYTMYLKYQKKEQSQFYLDWIIKKLNEYKTDKRKINFNCDTKTMQNFILSLSQSSDSCVTQYNEYFGYLTSPDVFQLEVNVRKLESLFRSLFNSDNKTQNPQKTLDSLFNQTKEKFVGLSKKQPISELFDIKSNFYIINDYLTQNKPHQNTQSNNQSFSLSKIKKQFSFFMKLTELKFSFFNSFKSILSLLKQTENNEALLNQAKQQFKSVFGHIEVSDKHINNQMSWREQVKACWLFRETLFTYNNLVRMAIEETGKMKKLPKAIKNSIGEFGADLQKTVMGCVTGIKFGENIKVDPSLLQIAIDKRYLQKVYERDQVLRRLSSINQKQAKQYLLK